MKRHISLQGKTVLITGGSRGIGFATAKAVLRRGARVVITARDRERLLGAARALHEDGRQVFTQTMDVTDATSVSRGIDEILAQVGEIDVVVNNAGGATQCLFVDSSLESLKAELDLNYFGSLCVTKAVLPHMRQRQCGMIVNVASVLGFVPYPSMANYSASKAALVRFTEALNFELRFDGIDVMLFVPGHTDTDAIKHIKLDGPPVAKPEHVGEHLAAAICRRLQFAAHGGGNKVLLQLSRFLPRYARYILQQMAIKSFPPGTFGAPRQRGHTGPALECSKE